MWAGDVLPARVEGYRYVCAVNQCNGCILSVEVCPCRPPFRYRSWRWCVSYLSRRPFDGRIGDTIPRVSSTSDEWDPVGTFPHEPFLDHPSDPTSFPSPLVGPRTREKIGMDRRIPSGFLPGKRFRTTLPSVGLRLPRSPPLASPQNRAVGILVSICPSRSAWEGQKQLDAASTDHDARSVHVGRGKAEDLPRRVWIHSVES